MVSSLFDDIQIALFGRSIILDQTNALRGKGDDKPYASAET
jgi:hypothetical protein